VLLFGASLLGSAHCVAMCGPYVACARPSSFPAARRGRLDLRLRALFNLGRIATYGLIGLIVGAFGQIAQAVAAAWESPESLRLRLAAGRPGLRPSR
jgi:sulfite exporter TauE/SafE